MAKPTITSVSPATLWTAGQVLTVVGTNFKTWTIPGPTNGPLPSPTPTMQVSVDGVLCLNVAVQAPTGLTFKAIAHDAGTASVVITNLDSSGVPIVGESSDPFVITYARPDLTAVVDLERVNTAVILLLRQQILANVVTFVSTDYSETPFESAMVGRLPALLLAGPNIVESEGEYRQNAQIEVGTFSSYQEPEVVNLNYELTGVTDNERQLVNLQGVVQRFFRKTRTVTIQRDAADSSKGNVTYVLEKRIGDAIRSTTTANKQNVRSFDVSFRVIGVVVEGLAGFTEENLVSRGGVADNIVVSYGPVAT